MTNHVLDGGTFETLKLVDDVGCFGRPSYLRTLVQHTHIADALQCDLSQGWLKMATNMHHAIMQSEISRDPRVRDIATQFRASAQTIAARMAFIGTAA